MYPIGVKIEGIRDFLPIRIALGNDISNVLIGGLNGSGKSTLVYAIAYAMGSNKISPNILRSKNIDENASWSASVSVTFHNPHGPYRVDAPEYIEVRVNTSSVSATTYFVYGGNHIDHMEKLYTFRSRESACDYYKTVLKIDADGYFMFWFQGTITMFTNLSDNERFIKVAEMFGIDKHEEMWREALTSLEEAEQELRKSKRLEVENERDLRVHLKDYNDLKDRNNLRAEGIAGKSKLIGLYNQLLSKKIEDTKNRLNEVKPKLAELERKQEEFDQLIKYCNDKKHDLMSKKDKLDLILKHDKNEHSLLRKQIKEKRQKCSEINKELEEIRGMIGNIRNRDLLIRDKAILGEKLSNIKNSIQKINEEITYLNNTLEELNQKKGAAKFRIKTIIDDINTLEAKDKIMPTLEVLLSELKDNEDYQNGLQRSLILDTDKLNQLMESADVISKRTSLLTEGQSRLKERLSAAGYEIATFGEIFDIVEESERDRVEKVFSPLKHTIFVKSNPNNIVEEGAFYVVETDKYMGLTPNDELLKLIFISQDIRRKYSKEFINGLLGWTHHISLNPEDSSEGNYLKLVNGAVLDAYGHRGPVQNERVIGPKALELLRERTNNDIACLKQRISKGNKELSEIKGIITSLRNDIETRKNMNEQLPLLKMEQKTLEEDRGEMELETDSSNKRLEEVQDLRISQSTDRDRYISELNRIDEELSIHEKFDGLSEKIDTFNNLSKEIEESEAKERFLSEEVEESTNVLQNIDTQILEVTSEIRLKSAENSNIEKEIKRWKEEAATLTSEILNNDIIINEKNTELLRMEKEFNGIYDAVMAANIPVDIVDDVDSINLEYLDRKYEQYEKFLSRARNTEVKEDAEVIYNEYLRMFNESHKQLEEAETRFRVLKEKEERHRNDLDRMIYDRYRETNSLFKEYMARVGLEGEIRNITPNSEKLNDGYRWEILAATRAGHSLEKIKPESAKKIGVGVSGGERAVVSLMFALALLSQVEAKPPFYILDEFDSALDESRKHKVIDLYSSVLQRKIIIVSPKMHGKEYLSRFSTFHCIISNEHLESGRAVSDICTLESIEEYEKLDLEGDSI